MKRTPIGECVETVRSWNPARDAADQEIDYVDLGSVDNEQKVVVGAQKVVGREAPSRARQKVLAGDILVSTVRPYLNGAARVPDHLDGATASTGFCVLRASTTKVDPAYLFHWVKSPSFVADMVRKSTGASYPAVSDRIIRESLAPLPSLPEQRRISAILDQADALCHLRRQSLTRIGGLVHSAIERAESKSGSTTLPLPTAFWFQEGPGVRKWQFVDKGVKLLNVSNVTKNNRLETDRSKNHVSIEEAQGKYAHFLVEEGDLIMPCSGIPIAEDGFLETRSAFAESKHLPLCMNTSTIRFKALRNQGDLIFLQGWLQTMEFRRQITRLVTGTAQKNFGPSHLKQLLITLPSEASVEALGQEVQKIEKQRQAAAEGMEALNSLFASLQHRAFRGEL